MISTSFLRTLNPKRYQEFAEENRNRLKVYYVRTINKLNKQVRQGKNKSCKQKGKRCYCLGHPDEIKKRCFPQITESSENNSVYTRLKDRKKYLKNRQDRLRGEEKHMQKSKTELETKSIVLEFEETKKKCQRKLQKMEKQNLIECRKLVSLSKGQRSGRKHNNYQNPILYCIHYSGRDK